MDVKEQRKLDSANKLAFDTHVGVLMRLHGITKTVATGRAYAEGPGGLNARIARPPVLPPDPAFELPEGTLDKGGKAK